MATPARNEPLPVAVPPLEQGDRLTRAEFERRYDAMPGLKKAELIEGVVYMPSPVGLKSHGAPHFDVIGWLAVYRASTPGILGGDNSSIRLDDDNMPQPDALLLVEPGCGGQAKVGEDGYVEGAPELAAEVASSSVSYDLHAKFRVYRQHGVREYLVWRMRDDAIDWFVLRQTEYEPLTPDANGIYRSAVLPGLWLDARALIRRDLPAVLRVLQQGLQSPEHAAFVARLQSSPRSNP